MTSTDFSLMFSSGIMTNHMRSRQWYWNGWSKNGWNPKHWDSTVLLFWKCE